MQEHRPDTGWAEAEEADMQKLSDALKRRYEVVVFDGKNRKERRAAAARHRRSKRKNQDGGQS